MNLALRSLTVFVVEGALSLGMRLILIMVKSYKPGPFSKEWGLAYEATITHPLSNKFTSLSGTPETVIRHLHTR